MLNIYDIKKFNGKILYPKSKWLNTSLNDIRYDIDEPLTKLYKNTRSFDTSYRPCLHVNVSSISPFFKLYIVCLDAAVMNWMEKDVLSVNINSLVWYFCKSTSSSTIERINDKMELVLSTGETQNKRSRNLTNTNLKNGVIKKFF